jgi:hypothetical protein
MVASEKVTDGPIGVGTRFRATIGSRRRPLHMDIEYTGYDRPRRIASTAHIAQCRPGCLERGSTW